MWRSETLAQECQVPVTNTDRLESMAEQGAVTRVRLKKSEKDIEPE